MKKEQIEQLEGIRNNILQSINHPHLIKWHINDLDNIIYKVKQGKNNNFLGGVSGSDLFTDMGKFVDKTFPNATAKEHLMKLKQESQEAIEAPMDIMEYADSELALHGAAHKAGFTYKELQEAKKQKLEILKNRSWEKQADGTYQHYR